MIVSNPTAHSPGFKSDLVGVGLLWLGAAHGDITRIFPLDHIVLIEVFLSGIGRIGVQKLILAPRSVLSNFFLIGCYRQRRSLLAVFRRWMDFNVLY